MGLRLISLWLVVVAIFGEDVPLKDASARRASMMKHKQELHAARGQCRADDNCMDEQMPTSIKAETWCINGFAGEYPCSNVNMLSQTTISELCGSDCGVAVPQMTGADSWGWDDPVNGDEYAIMTMSTGTSFVKVTDPENPEVIAYMPGTDHAESLWRDAKVLNDAAFIGSEYVNHGIQVFDLNRLRTMTSGTRVVVQPDTTYTGVGNSHNVVESASSNTLFVVGATRGTFNPPLCAGGLYALDVSDPLNPVYGGGCFGWDTYVHDAQCLVYNGPDSNYAGRELCFCYNEEDLVIADVTDKNNMVPISKVNYAGNYYTHQGWLTESHATLLLDDELDESNNHDGTSLQRTLIWNITDLANPTLENTYYSSVTAIDHNQYVLGDLTFQGNYESGVRILRIDEENYDLNEVGFFDTYPDRNTVEFNGVWTAYPYLPSGNIVVSTFGRGLFMLRYTGN